MKFVGVCGGRDFNDYHFLCGILENHVNDNDVVVTGFARGADSLADQWAVNSWRQVIRIPALWQYGRQAGFVRNEVIASLPLRLLIAFKGGNGTADMIRRAKAHGIEVLEAK